MFGIFKKKSKDADLSVAYVSNEVVQKQTAKAGETYAKPDNYTGNRELYDSGASKMYVKKAAFAGEKTVRDPYTGKKLVLTKKEAKALYGKNWSKHLAESDHIRPLEQIHQDTKRNAWNTTEDIKLAANSTENLRPVSREYNNAKRSRTNTEYVEDEAYLQSKGIELTMQGRQQAIDDDRKAEKAINTKLRSASRKNALKTGHEAGKLAGEQAGIMAATMAGIQNVGGVLRGEKSAKEAVKDTMEIGGKAAVTAYSVSGGATVLSHTLANSSSKFMQALTAYNVPATVITAVLCTGDTLNRWMNEEITTQQCLIELGEKGLNIGTMGYSMAVGQALIPVPVVGAAIGALVGSMATSNYYNHLIETLQNKELEHQERVRIIDECNAVAEQAKAFREELEMYLENYFKEYQDCFDEAIELMQFAYQAGDADGVIAGANQITRKLNGNVFYETVEEFKSFIDNDEMDIL